MQDGAHTDDAPVRLNEAVPLVGPNGPYGAKELWARHDPAIPAEIVGQAATTDAQGAQFCVDGAMSAFLHWSHMSCDERHAALMRAFSAVEREQDALARLLATEVGKPLREAQLEVKLFLSAISWFQAGFDVFRSQAAYTPGDELQVVRRPHGVAVLVLPWNWPLFQLAGKLIPALLTGNTVIIKPSPMAALIVGRVVMLLNETLPSGTVSTVLGDTDTTVRTLLTDARVSFVSFTGSADTGRKIAAIVAQGPTRLVLELGGNDPAILRHDVVLDDRTIVTLMQSLFTTTGQGCQLIKRLLVHTSRHDELVARLTEGIDSYYRLGHGMDPETTLGPLVSAAQRDRVAAMVTDATARGATAISGGQGPFEPATDGWFHKPTVVIDCPHDAPLVHDEQFGPAIPIIRFGDDADAIRLANDTSFGLGSSVWSADVDAAHAIAQNLKAGVTYVNNHNAFAVFRDTAVGGIGTSGMGVEWGVDGLLEYTRSHIVSARKR